MHLITKHRIALKKLIVSLIVLSGIVSFNSGCSKKNDACKPNSPASEASQMQTFATAHGMTLTAHPSGLMYEIIDPGTGETATINSRISIVYVGQFMNGEEFDKQMVANNTQSNPAWALSGLIQGWQVGIPLIKEGGHIKLLVPSSMGYGCDQYYTIPGNSVLYFDIALVDVQ